MDKKINVLVVPSDKFGVGYYRSLNPHTYLDKLYGDEFDVEINYTPPFDNYEFFRKYDILHIHNMFHLTTLFVQKCIYHKYLILV
jgi:hypothetical protein